MQTRSKGTSLSFIQLTPIRKYHYTGNWPPDTVSHRERRVETR